MKLLRVAAFLIFIFFIIAYNLNAQQLNYASLNPVTISSFNVKSVTQNEVNASKILFSNKPLQLFIFLSPECPLSKNYTSTLNKLSQEYNQQVQFSGCISGKGFTTAEIQSFIKTYKISFPIFVDESKKFTNYVNATVTPEVILLDNKGSLVYSGAIDDWVQDLGQQKLTVSKHYLQDAISASLNNKAVPVKKTKAYGCLINDY